MVKKRTKAINIKQYSDIFGFKGTKIGDTLKIKLPKDYLVTDGPKVDPICNQLDNAILLLETRVSNAIAKIYSLM